MIVIFSGRIPPSMRIVKYYIDLLYIFICFLGGIPPSRWIVNYDIDILDGLVLGAVLGAHMPFLVIFC